MAQVIVGIDLSSNAARVAVLESAFRTAKLAALHELAYVPGTPRSELLKQVRAMLPEHVDLIVVGNDPRAVSTRLLSFPMSDPRKIEAALDFELESQVPYELTHMAIAWTLVPNEARGAYALSGVMPKAQLAELLAELEAADLDARAVMLPAAALTELVPPSQETVAIVSLGSSLTHLAVVRRGLRFARTIRAGGEDVDRRLAQRFKVDVAAARRAKESEARIATDTAVSSEDMRAISDAVIEGLAGVVRELATTLKALPPGEVPSRIVLTGGLSRLPGLAAHLEQRLGIACSLLDAPTALAPLELGGRAVGAEYSLALALALAGMRHGRSVALNFRRGEFAYAGDLNVYRGELVRSALGLGIVLALAILGAIVQFTMVSSEERRIDNGFCEATQKIMGQRICDPLAALSAMRQPGGAAGGVTVPLYSAAALYELMSRQITSDMDVTFENLELRVEGRGGEPDRVTGKGEAASFETTEQIVAKLKQDRCVQEAEVSKQRKTRDGGRVEFSLTVKIACPAGVLPGAGSGVASAASGPAAGGEEVE